MGETRALFHVCAGFVYSQVLLACVRLRVFDLLRDGPLTADAIASHTGLPTASIERLLRAATSLRLTDARSGDRFGLGVLGAAVAANPGIAAMVEHHAAFYADLADPVALLRAEKPATAMAAYWPYADADRPRELQDSEIAHYTSLMATSQALLSTEVIDAYDFTRHRVLLDVGGGDGTFLSAVAARAPALGVRLFDLPAVAARAQANFEAKGLGGRAIATGGDFYADPLPRGADIVSLVRVLFDHDDSSALKILRAAHAALPHDGTLLIAEPIPGGGGRDPIGDAYYSFYLLAMGRGRARSATDFARLLDAASFMPPRTLKTRNPLLTRLIATQPKKVST